MKENHFNYLVGTVIAVLLWLWLHKDLTAKRALELIESEGTLSIRLLLAAIVSLFALLMRANNRIDTDEALRFFGYVEISLGIGAAKIVGSRWAKRPPATTVKAASVTIPPTDPPLAGYTDSPDALGMRGPRIPD